jgi:hypothetical protein
MEWRNQFDDLEFIRVRLNKLTQHRTARGLTADEADEYRELCLRELRLLARRPFPGAARRRTVTRGAPRRGDRGRPGR